MNKSFKVVFSKARGALMVVSEATSSVQAKGTKTVIAAAAALVAGTALAAGHIDNVSSSLEGTTITDETWTFDSDYPTNSYVQPGEDGKAIIKDSTIKNITVTLNDTSGYPSAVGLTALGTKDKQASIEVTGSTFENITLTATGKVPYNNGPHGSAIAVYEGALSLNDSHFTNNSLVSTNEQAQGGALYMSMGDIDAKNTTFSGNKADASAATGELGAFGGGVLNSSVLNASPVRTSVRRGFSLCKRRSSSPI